MGPGFEAETIDDKHDKNKQQQQTLLTLFDDDDDDDNNHHWKDSNTSTDPSRLWLFLERVIYVRLCIFPNNHNTVNIGTRTGSFD